MSTYQRCDNEERLAVQNYFVRSKVKVETPIPSQENDIMFGRAAEAILHAVEMSRLDVAKQIFQLFSPGICFARLAAYSGCSLLDLACSSGFVDLVKFLVLECRLEVRTFCPDYAGALPIHFAASLGRLETVKFLLEFDESLLYAQDDLNRTPLCVAAENGRLGVVKYLIEERDADPYLSFSPDSYIPVASAAGSSKLAVVEYLINLEPEMINFVDADGENLVAIAASSPCDSNDVVQTIEFLVANGVDVNEPNESGLTPLHSCVLFGSSPQVVECLIRLGANLTAPILGDGRTIFDFQITDESILSIINRFSLRKLSHQPC